MVDGLEVIGTAGGARETDVGGSLSVADRIAAAYMQRSNGDLGQALAQAVADALLDLSDAAHLVSRGYSRGRPLARRLGRALDVGLLDKNRC